MRVERAASHKKKLAGMWNSYIDQNPTISTSMTGKGVFVLRVEEESPPPDEMALALGEWLYRTGRETDVWKPPLRARGH